MLRALIAAPVPSRVRLLSERLALAGFVVSAVSDGAALIGLLERSDYDVLVAHFRLPGMAGLDLLAWIRQRPEKDRMKVIMLYAGSPVVLPGDTSDSHRLYDAGADLVLTIPFNPLELVVPLEKWGMIHTKADYKRGLKGRD